MTEDWLLGRYETQRPGPTLLVVAGLHGNEPAGVLAARAVCRRLSAAAPPLRGSLVCIAGNTAALAKRVRFLDEDLNRCWSRESVAALLAADPATDNRERRTQRELIARFETLPRPVFVLDLHTTSGPTAPFALMADTLANHAFAKSMPIPKVMGLEETVDGTLLTYLNDQGHTAFVVESGQHENVTSIDHHEAVIWIALVACGCLDPRDVPALGGKRRQLRAATRHLPSVVELRYVHEAGEGFSLPKGWIGFRPVKKGEVMAHENGTPIPSRIDGRILMPRYQSEGTDGFFLVQAVGPWKLRFGRWVRRLKLDYFLPWFWPGVSREPAEAPTLRVRGRKTGAALRAVLRAFGYRRRHVDGDDILYAQRRG